MAKVVLIGDTHGKIKRLMRLHKQIGDTPSIQIGDMGCGFGPVLAFPKQHKFIRGNHDSPSLAQSHPNYLGEYGYLSDYNLFYIGGAFSIDYAWRQQAMREGSRPCWWEDEELSSDQLNHALGYYEAHKPKIVVSHECPSEVGMKLLNIMLLRPYKEPSTNSRTAQIMQQMFEIHQPDLWIFGHYHFTKQLRIGRTEFRCLNELETCVVDTDDACFDSTVKID